MPSIESRPFTSADESRSGNGVEAHYIKLGNVEFAHLSYEPGWRWSERIKPVAGTENCEVEHVGYVLSGAAHFVHSDGTTQEVAAGSVYRVEPGHDAWVIGDEPYVVLELYTD
ncbi:MAG TPA: cupin domain-containing protein [Candidatus Limnocylindrales bacterium]|nr:cupin domain-containing protein [Candidatus Limnocylindrales bacterium]